MKKLSFTKMHGLGNDVMVIDGTHEDVHLTPHIIQRLADRHRGIGFDQLLCVEPSPRDDVDFAIRIFNADGHEVGQCGNGIRCVTRLLHDQGRSNKDEMTFDVQGRVLRASYKGGDQVSVNMGAPVIKAISERLEIDGEAIELGIAELGNPHAVIQVARLEDAPVQRIGPQLEGHARFPDGVNVGFMQVIDRGHIRCRVFERGVGETLACGSGACAAMALGRSRDYLDAQVQVDLPGGMLRITWEGPGADLWMTGPAERVFEGCVELA